MAGQAHGHPARTILPLSAKPSLLLLICYDPHHPYLLPPDNLYKTCVGDCTFSTHRTLQDMLLLHLHVLEGSMHDAVHDLSL